LKFFKIRFRFSNQYILIAKESNAIFQKYFSIDQHSRIFHVSEHREVNKTMLKLVGKLVIYALLDKIQALMLQLELPFKVIYGQNVEKVCTDNGYFRRPSVPAFFYQTAVEGHL
jgi:hypothetical protein